MHTTSATQSLWLEAMPGDGYPRLDGDRTVDVAVLGGGITGLTAALLLALRGAQVAVVEADRVGGGVTGNNTAKITALQATMYSTLRRAHGREAAATAGLPVSWVDNADLPLPVAGAVRLDDQIALHPVRYAHGLAEAIRRTGSEVYEGTRATGLHEGALCRVVTTGGTVSAGHVIVATHYPVFDRGGYFARTRNLSDRNPGAIERTADRSAPWQPP